MGVEGSDYLVRVKMFWRWRWEAAETRVGCLSLVPREKAPRTRWGFVGWGAVSKVDAMVLPPAAVRRYQVGMVREYSTVYHTVREVVRSSLNDTAFPIMDCLCRLSTLSAGLSMLLIPPFSVQLVERGEPLT